MWLCKVVVFLTVTGFCYSIRRSDNNKRDASSRSYRRVFGQRTPHSEVDVAAPLQSPTFSILSHMAQPLETRPRRRTKPLALPIQGEELNAQNDDFTSRSAPLPFRTNRKPEPESRRISKPSFNIDRSEVERNFQKRVRPESGDETRKLPPVYVPTNPSTSPIGKKPVINNEPEFILAEEDDQFKPFIPNSPIYTKKWDAEKEIETSALLTPDPEGDVEIQEENGNSHLYTNYDVEQSKPHSHNEHAQLEAPNEFKQYAPPPHQVQSNERPAISSITQKPYKPYADEPEPVTYRPKPNRVNFQRPIKVSKYQPNHPNSYSQFDLAATPYQQPERNLAPEPKPRPSKPQNVHKKILRKQPTKTYNNNPEAIKVPQPEKREAYDQHGSHSGGGYLDQNGVEFVSDASKTLKDSGGHGRITFQIHGQEGPHSYRFGYDTGKGPHRQFRYEEKDGYGEVKGRYGYYDESGKLQLVNYSAHPEHGYQADVVPAPKY